MSPTAEVPPPLVIPVVKHSATGLTRSCRRGLRPNTDVASHGAPQSLHSSHYLTAMCNLFTQFTLHHSSIASDIFQRVTLVHARASSASELSYQRHANYMPNLQGYLGRREPQPSPTNFTEQTHHTQLAGSSHVTCTLLARQDKYSKKGVLTSKTTTDLPCSWPWWQGLHLVIKNLLGIKYRACALWYK